MRQVAKAMGAPGILVTYNGLPFRSSTSAPQLAAGKKPLELLNLPAELIKQIVSEVVTEEALALSSDKPYSIIQLLQANKRLNQEALERVRHIAAYGVFNIYIKAANQVHGVNQVSQMEEILAYWEHSLPLVPWEIFRKIRIFLMPGLYRYGLRSWSLEKLFDITLVVATKLQETLSERVQNGDCNVEVVYCEIDGKHASHHHKTMSDTPPLPCWAAADLGWVLETWLWLRRPKTNISSVIQLPNVSWLSRDGNDIPSEAKFWSNWLRAIWERGKPLPFSDQFVSRLTFLRKHRDTFRIVIPRSYDKFFLLNSAAIEIIVTEGPTLTWTNAAEIVSRWSPQFTEADDILEKIKLTMEKLPDPQGELQARYVQAADDLHSKAYRCDRPGEAGLEEITGRLNDFLQDLRKTPHIRKATRRRPPWRP